VKALKKLNRIEKNLEMCFLQVQNSKTKMKEIKSHLLQTSSKFLLYKQKLKNLLTIHNVLKNNLNKYHLKFRESKQFKKNNKYGELLEYMTQIQTNIKNEKGLPKGLLINHIILQKSAHKIEKLEKVMEQEKNSIFIEEKGNYLQIFKYCVIKENNYIDVIIIIFKTHIFLDFI
jgi:hypothetical protein